MSGEFVNIHGRKPTRGLRPFLLIPKVLCVAVYFGALCASLFLWTLRGKLGPGGTLQTIETLFRWLCWPALTGAVFFGFLLLLQHPRILARQRWWQVKMAWLVASIPLSEWLVLGGFDALRGLGAGSTLSAAHAADRITLGLSLLVGANVVLIILGRQKPRLGQNWALASPRPMPLSPRGQGQPQPPASPGAPGPIGPQEPPRS